MSSPAQRVLVLGAGTMGSGIAQVCLVAGHDVTLHDAAPGAYERGRDGIAARLERQVEKDRIPRARADDAMARLHWAPNMAEASAAADVVVEAIVEETGAKEALWRTVGAAAPSAALLTTNTSSLSVTGLARASGRPGGFCGLHFFNPAPRMPLVEVVRGLDSDDATVERARAFAEGLGKTAIVCEDRPGFLVNRLLIPYLNEAAFLVADGADPVQVDRAMELGANVPMGPLALADLIGLDVTLSVAETLHRELGDPKYRPAPLLRQYVRAGRFGRKSGRGFHRYDEGGDA